MTVSEGGFAPALTAEMSQEPDVLGFLLLTTGLSTCYVVIARTVAAATASQQNPATKGRGGGSPTCAVRASPSWTPPPTPPRLVTTPWPGASTSGPMDAHALLQEVLAAIATAETQLRLALNGMTRRQDVDTGAWLAADEMYRVVAAAEDAHERLPLPLADTPPLITG